MTEYRYQLDMAGLVWEFVSPVELERSENCEPFGTDRPGADCRVRFRLGCPEARGTLLRESLPRAWQDGRVLRIERAHSAAMTGCACIDVDLDRPQQVDGWMYPDRTGMFRNLANLLDASDLETLFALFDAFSLHSSLVRRQEGDAILFTAPCGTGKSTQAALWERYAGADTLNGDRSLLRAVDGVWTAFGSPFAGSSGIYRKESAPVRALVVLRQAPENSICRLRAAEAFRAIYSESVLPRWHTETHQRVIELITAIVNAVPVYRLACTPDERAVTLLRETLEGEEP